MMLDEVVELAKEILASTNNNLHELGKKDIAFFQSFHGVGEAKAIKIISALEIGRRRLASPILEKPRINCSNDAYQVFIPVLFSLSSKLNRCSFSV